MVIRQRVDVARNHDKKVAIRVITVERALLNNLLHSRPLNLNFVRASLIHYFDHLLAIRVLHPVVASIFFDALPRVAVDKNNSQQ